MKYRLYLSLLFLVSQMNDYIKADEEIGEEARGHAQLGNYPFMNMKWCGRMSPKDVEKGDLRFAKRDTPDSRIVNGELAREGQFPWMASLHYKGNSTNDTFLCGGTLIHKYWVLTAGHCLDRVRDNSKMVIYLGSVEKYKFYNYFNILGFDLHPYWDLALIRLKTEARPEYMANHFIINYICLPKPSLINDQFELAEVSGFGFMDKKAKIPSTNLRKRLLTISPSKECIERNYTEFQICSLESEHMTCFGDSGSALMQFDQNRAVLIGIVGGGRSFNKEVEICGPGILYFQRISLFIDWIAYIIDLRKDIEKEIEKGIHKNKNITSASEEEGLGGIDGESGNDSNLTAVPIEWTIILCFSLNFIKDISFL